MIFAQRFKEILENNDISPKRLAANLNISHSSIYLFLHTSYPSIKNAVKLANYFNCTLNYLLGIDVYPDEYDFYETYDVGLFLQRYKSVLIKKRISHYRVSKEIRLGNSAIKDWTCGSEPKVETLIKISKFLDCTIDFLIDRSDFGG